jgi:type I restriction enzyme S subunit
MADINKLITDNLDVWISAIKKRNSQGRGSSKKIQLTGIKKLRKLILELAVRGKLVPQYNNDESVTVLLDKIAAEKKQLIVDKKLKKQQPLLAITDEEIPFEIPTSWNFKRFGDVMFNRDGERKPVSAAERKGIQGKYDYYGASGVIDQVNGFLFDKSLLLIGEDGANLISRSTPIAFLAHGKYWVNNHAHVLDGITTQFLEFIALHINAISLEDYITGTAQPKMNQAKMNSIVVAIPPKAEQHRIVAKVDELMALCDQLEQQTEESLSAHQTLVEVLLLTLTESKNAEDFQTSWQRIAEHFDVLFTTEHSIEQLKQTILQLAVMGKLVPQNPNDEPASVLLKKIAEEKAQLIADKKIKKQKPLAAITDDEKPFELPSSWGYERIGTFGIVGTGPTPSRSNPDYWHPAEFNWVSSGETSEFFLSTTKEKVSALAIKETNVSLYPAGTLIVAMYGQGKTRGQITELLSEAGTNQACAAIRLVNETKQHKDYVKIYFRKAYAELRSHAAGGAQPNLNVGKISNTVLALPPLAEQHRIVAKVEELMALCEQLKAHLSDAQTTQLHLADAIVENALN